MDYVLNEKNRLRLLHEGFLFYNYSSCNDSKYWRCICYKKGCHMCVHYNTKQKITKITGEHKGHSGNATFVSKEKLLIKIRENALNNGKMLI